MGPHSLTNVDLPPIPAITASGAYDSADVKAFIRHCKLRKLRADQIATALKIPLHTAIFWLNK